MTNSKWCDIPKALLILNLSGTAYRDREYIFVPSVPASGDATGSRELGKRGDVERPGDGWVQHAVPWFLGFSTFLARARR